MAGNPFRRTPSNRPEDDQQAPARDPTPPLSKPRTIKKKVKIQTPPHSPEESRRPSSENISPPPPPIQQNAANESEDSDSTATADSELEEAWRNTRRNSGSLTTASGTLPLASTVKAPYNPFARTLATTEAAYGSQHVSEEAKQDGKAAHTRGGAAARPAMDVDQFKNILMGGAAAPATTLSRPSFTDDYNTETPRTSLDHMDDLESASSDGDEHSNLMSGADRLDDLAPPAPPKPNAPVAAPKGPQTVSFADFKQSFQSTASTPPVTATPSEKLRPAALQRQHSDLNKPLPDPPPLSPNASRALASTTETASSQQYDLPTVLMENIDQFKKAPPPPPTARRLRSSSNPKQDSSQGDGKAMTARPMEATSKGTPPPPPPPSRKSKPSTTIQKANTDPPQIAEQSSSSSEAPPIPPTEPNAMPPPPPPRTSAKLPATLLREASDSSLSSTSRIEPPPTPSAPPAPPRRRAGANSNRTSIDGRPASMKDHRRSSSQSVDTQHSNSLHNLERIKESVPPTSEAGEKRDILADMSAFQAEIDALRAKAGNG